MPKSPAKTALTELVTAGQPSAGLIADLRAIGARLTDGQIGECYVRVERHRRRFSADVVRLGVMLLAKKEALPHGRWHSWIEAMTKLAEPAILNLPPLVQEKSYRACRVYMQVGKHFLADAEQKSFHAEARDMAPAALKCSPLDLVLFAELPKERQSAVEEAIETFVCGRSLDRMLIDFRRAEGAADQEEIEEANRRKPKKDKPADPAQMDFFQDMLRPIGEIDALFDDKQFVKHTDKAFWTGVADKLETQARRARTMAKEIAG